MNFSRQTYGCTFHTYHIIFLFQPCTMTLEGPRHPPDLFTGQLIQAPPWPKRRIRRAPFSQNPKYYSGITPHYIQVHSINTFHRWLHTICLYIYIYTYTYTVMNIQLHFWKLQWHRSLRSRRRWKCEPTECPTSSSRHGDHPSCYVVSNSSIMCHVKQQ